MYNYNPYQYQSMVNPLTGVNHHQMMNHSLMNNARGLTNNLAHGAQGARGALNSPRAANSLLGLGNNLRAGTGLAKTGLSGINWSGLFGNASKALGFINQTLPVYNQVKPVVNNARTMFRVMKAMRDDKKIEPKQTTYKSDIPHQTIPLESRIAVNKSAPTFFK